MSLIDDLSEQCLSRATALVADVAAMIEEEADQKPTLGDLCETLAYGIIACRDDTLEDINPRSLVELRPVVRKHAKPSPGAAPLEPIDEIHDACFDRATTLITELCAAIEKEAGRKPTIGQLSTLLARGLRSCPDELLADISPRSVAGLKPVVQKRRKVTLRPGDVVAVPSRRGDYHLLVFIVNNGRFGPAFGLLKGRRKFARLPGDWCPKAIQPPWYTGLEKIYSGEWPVVGNDPELLRLFPAEPEYFHRPDDDPHDERPSPFGTAENEAGDLRDLSREEAEAIGLLDGRYVPNAHEEIIVDHLDRLN